MKKLIAVMMCLVMTMAMLAGCGNAGGTGAASGDGLKIAIVSSPSGVDD